MKYAMRAIVDFVAPFYADKDIMHDLSHLERVRRQFRALADATDLKFDRETAEVALYFHGIIYTHESQIRDYLAQNDVSPSDVDLIVRIAWESQKDGEPSTNEGRLLHDAHLLEGGRNFEIIKSLITGSIRRQTFEETMIYIEQNLLNGRRCYTEEGIRRYAITQARTREIFDELNRDLGRM